jgi:hypothetical protein
MLLGLLKYGHSKNVAASVWAEVIFNPTSSSALLVTIVLLSTQLISAIVTRILSSCWCGEEKRQAGNGEALFSYHRTFSVCFKNFHSG